MHAINNMNKKKILKTLGIVLIFTTVFVFSFTTINAQNFDACDFLGCETAPGGGANVVGSTESLIRFAGSLIFAGFTAFGIFIIIKAALKIVRSESNQEEVESGAKAVKSVFIGFGILIVGLIGLILLSGITGLSGLFDDQIENPAGIDDLPFTR